MQVEPVFASTESDDLRLGYLTQCQCVIRCDLTTCSSIERTWFQHLNLSYDKLFSKFAFTFNLRRYIRARHDEETAALAKRQANFQRDRDQMSRAEEEDYDKACDESMFRIHILEQRLKRHEVGRCRSTATKPVLKAPMVSALDPPPPPPAIPSPPHLPPPPPHSSPPPHPEATI